MKGTRVAHCIIFENFTKRPMRSVPPVMGHVQGESSNELPQIKRIV